MDGGAAWSVPWKNCHAAWGCNAVAYVSAWVDVMPFLINGEGGAYSLFPHALLWGVREVMLRGGIRVPCRRVGGCIASAQS